MAFRLRALAVCGTAALLLVACQSTKRFGGFWGVQATDTGTAHVYRLVDSIRVGGNQSSSADLVDDPQARRLYVTHGGSVVVIDTDTKAVVGHIDSLPDVRAFTVAGKLGRGFASEAREDDVAIVDLGTLRVVSRVAVGRGPEGILYVPRLKEVYAFNRGGRSVTVIDAAKGRVVATIPLPGTPGAVVYDSGRDRVYASIEDQNEIAVLDPATRTVEKTWPIAPGESATGLAVDPGRQRLFVSCENGVMVMLDDVDGLLSGTIPIGHGSGAARFDPLIRLAFSANGDGTVTVAHFDGPTQLTVLQTLHTMPSAATMALDPRTHRIYVSGAELRSGRDSAHPGGGQAVVPGSFRVLVFGLVGS